MDPFDQFAREPWVRDALCAQTGPDDNTWFPHPGGSTHEAKQTCAGCPVIAACLAHTLATESPSARFGIYGGTSAVERQVLTGARDSSRKNDRAAIIARLATIGVDVEAIVADLQRDEAVA